MKLLDDSAFTTATETVVVHNAGKDVAFTVEAPGYLEYQHIVQRAAAEGKSPAAILIAACVTGPEGEKFTYDEARRLKKAYADAFAAALYRLLELDPEKN